MKIAVVDRTAELIKAKVYPRVKVVGVLGDVAIMESSGGFLPESGLDLYKHRCPLGKWNDIPLNRGSINLQGYFISWTHPKNVNFVCYSPEITCNFKSLP